MKIRRLVSLMMALMLAIALAAPASAADLTYDVPGGKLCFDASTGTITRSDMTVTEVVIPEQIYGVTVTKIGSAAFYNRQQLTSVTIPATVTAIDSGTFYGCDSLTGVYYGSDAAHWSQVEVGGLNEGLDQSAIHFAEPVAGFSAKADCPRSDVIYCLWKQMA